MDLFDYMREKNMDQEAPLASRLRPTTLEEVYCPNGFYMKKSKIIVDPGTGE